MVALVVLREDEVNLRLLQFQHRNHELDLGFFEVCRAHQSIQLVELDAAEDLKIGFVETTELVLPVDNECIAAVED